MENVLQKNDTIPVIMSNQGRKKSNSSARCKQIQNKLHGLVRTIYVLENGDPFSQQHKFVLTHMNLKNWEATLDMISQKMKLKTGALRSLRTLDGDVLRDPRNLKNDGIYVAVGNCDTFKPMSYFGGSDYKIQFQEQNKLVHQMENPNFCKLRNVKRTALYDDNYFYFIHPATCPKSCNPCVGTDLKTSYNPSSYHTKGTPRKKKSEISLSIFITECNSSHTSVPVIEELYDIEGRSTSRRALDHSGKSPTVPQKRESISRLRDYHSNWNDETSRECYLHKSVNRDVLPDIHKRAPLPHWTRPSSAGNEPCICTKVFDELTFGCKEDREQPNTLSSSSEPHLFKKYDWSSRRHDAETPHGHTFNEDYRSINVSDGVTVSAETREPRLSGFRHYHSHDRPLDTAERYADAYKVSPMELCSCLKFEGSLHDKMNKNMYMEKAIQTEETSLHPAASYEISETGTDKRRSTHITSTPVSSLLDDHHSIYAERAFNDEEKEKAASVSAADKKSVSPQEADEQNENGAGRESIIPRHGTLRKRSQTSLQRSSTLDRRSQLGLPVRESEVSLLEREQRSISREPSNLGGSKDSLFFKRPSSVHEVPAEIGSLQEDDEQDAYYQHALTGEQQGRGVDENGAGRESIISLTGEPSRRSRSSLQNDRVNTDIQEGSQTNRVSSTTVQRDSSFMLDRRSRQSGMLDEASSAARRQSEVTDDEESSQREYLPSNDRVNTDIQEGSQTNRVSSTTVQRDSSFMLDRRSRQSGMLDEASSAARRQSEVTDDEESSQREYLPSNDRVNTDIQEGSQTNRVSSTTVQRDSSFMLDRRSRQSGMLDEASSAARRQSEVTDDEESSQREYLPSVDRDSYILHVTTKEASTAKSGSINLPDDEEHHTNSLVKQESEALPELLIQQPFSKKRSSVSTEAISEASLEERQGKGATESQESSISAGDGEKNLQDSLEDGGWTYEEEEVSQSSPEVAAHIEDYKLSTVPEENENQELDNTEDESQQGTEDAPLKTFFFLTQTGEGIFLIHPPNEQIVKLEDFKDGEVLLQDLNYQQRCSLNLELPTQPVRSIGNSEEHFEDDKVLSSTSHFKPQTSESSAEANLKSEATQQSTDAYLMSLLESGLIPTESLKHFIGTEDNDHAKDKDSQSTQTLLTMVDMEKAQAFAKVLLKVGEFRKLKESETSTNSFPVQQSQYKGMKIRTKKSTLPRKPSVTALFRQAPAARTKLSELSKSKQQGMNETRRTTQPTFSQAQRKASVTPNKNSTASNKSILSKKIGLGSNKATGTKPLLRVPKQERRTSTSQTTSSNDPQQEETQENLPSNLHPQDNNKSS